MRRGRAWGNALGGWRSQPRGKGGKFARKGAVRAAKRTYKSTKRKNMAAHKQRAKSINATRKQMQSASVEQRMAHINKATGRDAHVVRGRMVMTSHQATAKNSNLYMGVLAKNRTEYSNYQRQAQNHAAKVNYINAKRKMAGKSMIAPKQAMSKKDWQARQVAVWHDRGIGMRHGAL